MFDEKSIVASILSGNLRAFDKLVKQYENLVFYIVNKMINDNDDKEDICQEVFIKVYNQLSRFEYKSMLSTWIAQIAYRTTLNYIRDTKKHKVPRYPENVENFHFTTEDPEQLLNKKDIATYVNKMINELPLQMKTVITLYHLNEFSYSEIEEITGFPEGTVKSHLFRARKLLKEKIEIHLKNGQYR